MNEWRFGIRFLNYYSNRRRRIWAEEKILLRFVRVYTIVRHIDPRAFPSRLSQKSKISCHATDTRYGIYLQYV